MSNFKKIANYELEIMLLESTVTYCKYLQENAEENVKKPVIIAAKWHEPIVPTDAGQQ
jgi:hypothetical protein